MTTLGGKLMNLPMYPAENQQYLNQLFPRLYLLSLYFFYREIL